MPNALRITQFMSPGGDNAPPLEGIRAPQPGERVVYAPGVFDLMRNLSFFLSFFCLFDLSQNNNTRLVVFFFLLIDVGHVKFLEKCRQLGTYLIVGLHSDEVWKEARVL